MMTSKLIVGFAMVALTSTAAVAAGPSLQDQMQAACYDDVMRLCSDAVPDVDAVKTCMMRRKHQVSAKCVAFYPKSPK